MRSCSVYIGVVVLVLCIGSCSGAISITEYIDAGCTVIAPAGSTGPLSPFFVDNGACYAFGAGSTVAYLLTSCDKLFFQVSMYGSSSTNCAGAPDNTVTGPSGQCTQILGSKTYVKVNCNAGAPAASTAMVAQFSDPGCTQAIPIASMGTAAPIQVSNGQCTTYTAGSTSTYITTTFNGAMFSLSVWGSSGANCQGVADSLVMGGTGVCTQLPSTNYNYQATYIMVTPTPGTTPPMSGTGSITEYANGGCSVVAPASSNGPASFTFTNGVCQAYNSGSGTGYFKLSVGCDMYSLTVYGSSSTNCQGAPASNVIGATNQCGHLIHFGTPYTPISTGLNAVVSFNGGVCNDAIAQYNMKPVQAIIITVATIIITTIYAHI